MSHEPLAWVVAIPLLGLMTGNRTLTPIAVVCWFAWLGRMPIHHTWAFWTTMLVTPIVFSVLALGEYIGDKLPKTPNRTAAVPLVGRTAFGCLVGAICATSLHGALIEGVLLGAIGAIAGSFLGYRIRYTLTKVNGFPDMPVAIAEDLLTLCLSIIAMRIVTA